MSWFDSITDLFSSDESNPTDAAVDVALAYTTDPNMMLSNKYRMKDLTATNQSLSQPNIPAESYMIENLQITASILEYLERMVGPFKILSGFRTKELQDKLTSQGEPTSSGLSFHEIGRAVDIAPSTMSLDDFFGKMLADEEISSQFSEIAIKPSQHTLHLSVNVPSDMRSTKVLGLNTEGLYAKLNAEDIASYIAPFIPSGEDAYDYAAAKLVTYNKTPIYLALAAALGGIAYVLSQPRRSVRLNPRVRESFPKFSRMTDGQVTTLEKRLREKSHDVINKFNKMASQGEHPSELAKKISVRENTLHLKWQEAMREVKRRGL